MIARTESAAWAKLLIEESVAKHGVEPGTLVLHSDRGAPMTSKCLAQLLADLDVARSFSRPHTSNDNPFSESHFKTAKYHPSYPGTFATLEQGVAWGRTFFPWYNDEHKHSGIAFLTPADAHYGRGEARLAARHAVLQAAYAAHPERFPHGPPKRQVLPAATYINPPLAKAQ
jgi:putative transposase